MRAVPETELVSPEFGNTYALICSNNDASQHLVRYVADRLEDADLFHEFCHAKMNEIGFKKVETEMERRGQSLPSNQREVQNRAVILIAEVYANALLFSNFRNESESIRANLDYSCLFTNSLRSVVQALGYTGIAQIVGHRVSRRWSGQSNDNAFRLAFEQTFSGGERVAYTEIHTLMSRLP